MNVLIFNCGSSSQGFKLYQSTAGEAPVVIAAGKAKNVATQTQARAVIEWTCGKESGSISTDLSSHRLAAEGILSILRTHDLAID